METQTEPILQNSGSYNAEEKTLHFLINKVKQLETKVHDLTVNKISEELQISAEELQKSDALPRRPHRLKHGNRWRPLLESEIKEAQSIEKNITAADCARYLEISYETYRKYCKLYGLHKTNQWGRGSKKRYWDPNKGKYPLNKILNGEFPDYPPYRLKDLLIRSNVKKAECEQCGYCERRIVDNRIPLVLNFEDGNCKNHKLENMRILCYNCTFTCGRGYIRNERVDMHFNNPDRMQGAKINTENRF